MDKFIRCKKCFWEGEPERLLNTTTGTVCPACGYSCSRYNVINDDAVVVGLCSTGDKAKIYAITEHRHKAYYILRNSNGQVCHNEKVASVEVAKARLRNRLPSGRWRWISSQT